MASGRGGIDRDPHRAAELFEGAAEQGLAEAQYALGVAYDSGGGVDQSYTEAMGWYTKAAEQGHLDAMFAIGNLWANGNGVSQDKNTAAKWYCRAAMLGHEYARQMLDEAGDLDAYCDSIGGAREDLKIP